MLEYRRGAYSAAREALTAAIEIGRRFDAADVIAEGRPRIAVLRAGGRGAAAGGGDAAGAGGDCARAGEPDSPRVLLEVSRDTLRELGDMLELTRTQSVLARLEV